MDKIRKAIFGGNARDALDCFGKWDVWPQRRQRPDPQLGQKLLTGHPKERRVTQWAAMHGSPLQTFWTSVICEPNTSFHRCGSLREPLSPLCWAAGQGAPLELPKGLLRTDRPSANDTSLDEPTSASSQLPLDCTPGDSSLEQGHLSRFPYLRLGDSSLQICCEDDPQKRAEPAPWLLCTSSHVDYSGENGRNKAQSTQTPHETCF